MEIGNLSLLEKSKIAYVLCTREQSTEEVFSDLPRLTDETKLSDIKLALTFSEGAYQLYHELEQIMKELGFAILY